MLKKAGIVYLVVLYGWVNAQAQQIPLGNQYLINKTALSPAYAGHNDNFEAFIDFRQSWMGVPGAPNQKALNINGPIYENMGVGASVSAEQMGIFNAVSLSLSYAYHLQIAAGQSLNFGVAGGAYENHIAIPDGSSEVIDPMAMSNQNVSATLFDVGAGLYYKHRNFNAGVAFPRLTTDNIENTTTGNSIYEFSRHYNVHFSYLYEINQNILIEPYAVVRTTQNSPVFFEAAALIKYQKQLWTGLMYRKGNALGLLFGGRLFDRVAMNYSYELGQGMLAASSGTHQFTLGFLIGKDKNKASSVFYSDPEQPYYDWIGE